MKTLTKILAVVAPLALAAGCTNVQSSSAEVDRPGTWRVSFLKLVDVDGPPYVVTEPAPEYPARTMHAPAVSTGCTPGCTCAWATSDDCTGDVGQTCRADGGFVETCPDQHTILDCGHILFDSDTHTQGVCVLEDSSKMDQFGYVQLGRYQITFDRQSYDGQ